MNNIAQNNFSTEIRSILQQARTKAQTAVNASMVEAYWFIGKRIVEEVRQFYLTFPDLRKSYTLCSQLSWR